LGRAGPSFYKVAVDFCARIFIMRHLNHLDESRLGELPGVVEHPLAGVKPGFGS
jgi:hypothetical protein